METSFLKFGLISSAFLYPYPKLFEKHYIKAPLLFEKHNCASFCGGSCCKCYKKREVMCNLNNLQELST